jgi:predicted SprT family Zn-dependent metalloprotease
MGYLAIILTEMTASSLDKLIARLDETGAAGRAARKFIVSRRVRVRLRRQSTGARWTPLGHIELNPSQLEDEVYALSLIVHEVCHLKQGIFGALSVRGELEAWQEQFAYLRSLTGKYSNSSSQQALIEELMGLALDDRADLTRARSLMRKYAGKKYRIGWLPSYPLGKEIRGWMRGK